MTNTIMEQEARTAPQKIAGQLEANAEIMQQLGEKLRAFDPRFVMIVGRGSSDHAGVLLSTYLKSKRAYRRLPPPLQWRVCIIRP